MLNFVLFLILNSNSLLLHDFHVSVCEIEYDEKRKALEVTQRIFLDDLEETLKLWSGDNNVDVMNPKDILLFQEMLEKYLLEHFTVKVNGEDIALNYLGAEIEDDAMYSYIDITGVRKLKSIEIKNTILTEMYEAQTNIVHILVNKKTRSLKLDKTNPNDIIQY